MNARFDSEHAYMAHQSLMMGLAHGGGISDIPSMSQSYRRAVLRNPPKGEYVVEVLPPQKHNSNWHYGGRVLPAGSNRDSKDSSGKPFKEYTIWRKWEDCLDLQKAVEREFSYFSAQRRKQQLLALNAPPTPTAPDASPSGRRANPPPSMYGGSSSFYMQPVQRAASFDSLPSGPEPLSLALDVHTLLPKLSKKTALFGKPSAQLLQQRADDFRAFIEALFQIHTPVFEDVRQARDIRDWFGWWRRDKEGAMKAAQQNGGGLNIPASPGSSHSSPSGRRESLPAHLSGATQGHRDTLGVPAPPEHRASSASGSSGSGSSSSLGLDGGHDGSASDEDDEDETLDTFPHTPAIGPQNPAFTPVIRTTSTESSAPRSLPSPIIPMNRAKSFEPPSSAYYGFSVGGMIAPAPMFKSKSSTGRPTPAPIKTAPVQSVAPTPMLRTPRPQRPSTGGSAAPNGVGTFTSVNNAANRRAGVWIVEPEPRPHSASSSRPQMGRAQSMAGPVPSEHPIATPFNNHGLRVNTLLSNNRFEEERAQSAIEPSVTNHVPIPIPPRAANRPRAKTLASSPPPRSPTASPAASTIVGPEEPAKEPQDGVVSPMLQNFRHIRNKASDDASFLELALPVFDEPIPHAEQPAMRSRAAQHKRRSGPRGGRHSISSIESYLSDSSIDAALSTLRMGGVPNDVSPFVPSGLRRSMSTGRSQRNRSSSFVGRVPEERDEHIRDETALAIEEDEDVVDSYFYSHSIAPSSRPGSANRPAHPSPITPTSTAPSFIRRSNSISSTTTSAATDDIFSLKVLFPSFADCAAIALRLPRSTSFTELQGKLLVKFHEAEGIDLAQLRRGFRLGYKLPEKRSSVVITGRARSMSVGSGTMVDPSQLMIVKNDDDWKKVIPGPKEKLTLQVIVDS